MKVKRVRGTRDLYGGEVDRFNFIVNTSIKVLSLYGFREIKTPVIEHKTLFLHTVGPFSDIVEKEMFEIELKGGEVIVLRPEGTAPVGRAYVEGGMHWKEPFSRLFYHGPMFRYERPQKGRYREFNQIGAEIIGSNSPLADADVIAVGAHMLDACSIRGYELHLNSVGCEKCRPGYVERLRTFLKAHQDEICETCRMRTERNPMRVLDCKNEKCRAVYKNAPLIVNFLCDDCSSHFNSVKSLLDGYGINYNEDPFIVRGLDYYTRTAFEFIHPALGAQNAICAGGRYDGLISELGGPEIPGVGLAMGIERMMELIQIEESRGRDGVGFVILEPSWISKLLNLANTIRRRGVRCLFDYRMGSVKSQLRRLDSDGVRMVVIAGEEELDRDELTVKDLSSGEQFKVKRSELVEYLLRRLSVD